MSSALMERYWNGVRDLDEANIRASRHPDWVAEWPQTGERVRGVENDLAIHRAYPDYPAQELEHVGGQDEQWAITPLITPLRIRGTGSIWIAEARLRYATQGPHHSIAILELKDGLIHRETAYFAPDFEPLAWRAHLVEPIGDIATPNLADAFEEVDGRPSDELDHQAAIRRFVDALTAPEGAAREAYLTCMADLFAPDAIQEIVQSGERIRGLDRMLELVRIHPDFPIGSVVRRVIGIGDLWVLEARIPYAGQIWWEALVLQFRGPKVIRSREYYAPEVPAPAWRAQWVEALDALR